LGNKCIVLIGTLDTKGEELLFLKRQIEQRQCDVVMMDVSMGGEPLFEAEVGPQEIAQLGGKGIEEIRGSDDRDAITHTMEKGAIAKVKQLHSEGRLDGIVAIGGVTMALFGGHVMETVPFGVPKLIVCPGAMPAYISSWFDATDVTVMQGILDFTGLNELLQNVLVRVAGGICGMAQAADGSTLRLTKKSIAITQFGFSENCARLVRQHLEEKGYIVYPFHAQGIGDKAMDNLILQGFFDGVIDIVPAGVIEEMFKGNRAAGPKRLEAAGERGLPQVIAPGSVNITNAGPKRIYSEKYASREKKYKIDELRILTRYNAEELTMAAKVYADKLNKAKGPVKILIPNRGWSSLDREGSVLHAPKEDRVFVNALGRNLKPEIEIEELDIHLEDPPFASALVESFIHLS
jgi:uncharacterized protein (UPF0261 family)